MIAILTANMNNTNFKPLDEAGVTQVVNQLYSLQHFGKSLQNVKNITAQAHQATYRERPHRLPRNQNNAKSLLQNVWTRTPPHQPVIRTQGQFSRGQGQSDPQLSRNNVLVRYTTPSSSSSKGSSLFSSLFKWKYGKGCDARSVKGVIVGRPLVYLTYHEPISIKISLGRKLLARPLIGGYKGVSCHDRVVYRGGQEAMISQLVRHVVRENMHVNSFASDDVWIKGYGDLWIKCYT